MPKSTCTLVINGSPVKCRQGDSLLDAALSGRIVLPHDCCSGQCETCRVRVISGAIDDQGTGERDTVLGCLATVEGNAEIMYDPVPIAGKTPAVVEEISYLGRDVFLVKLRPSRQVTWLAGQYLRLTFKGYPAREFSPTFPLDLDRKEGLLTFHVRRYADGVVSGALGAAIRVGHKVSIRGPYGNSFLRHQTEPLVLVSTGTGFAPVWSMAVACVLGQPDRALSVIAGARESSDLYMTQAANWLINRGVSVALTAIDGDGQAVVRKGPSEFLSFLTQTHVVYAAGAPSMVDSVRRLAASVGARFSADPFYPTNQKPTFRNIVLQRLHWAKPALIQEEMPI